MSGPVAGVAAVTELARRLELGDVIAADVGGTSFDTCLISDGRAPVLYEGSIIGLPLQTPWVDVRSIGAGGGSIAGVDAGGLLRVGPQSAGARPGPPATGSAASEPTVTDAAVLLGMLPPGPIAGDVVLDPARAAAALEPLAAPLGFADAEEVARGVVRVACAHMADAIRSITIESGRDPRDAAIVAFGGAGPVLGTVLAHELDIAHDRRPAARRQPVGLGAARRRPRPDVLAHAADPAGRRRPARRPAADRRADRGARPPLAGPTRGASSRSTWTCATSARSTR